MIAFVQKRKKHYIFFENAHVDIRILSGDNPVTVARVAQLAGLKDGHLYIDASTLPEDELEIGKDCFSLPCFGRVQPEQKQRIMKLYKPEDMLLGWLVME
mgnify:CR=1 FL=1